MPPKVEEWERKCPDCGVPDGQLHDLFCLKECCPFCRGQLATCDCIKSVLKLSAEECVALDEYEDDSTEPLRTVMERWSAALVAKRRIPFRASSLPCSAEGLILAAGKGELSFVQTLLGKGIVIDAPNAVGYTPLMAAARSHRVDVVRYLLSKGANVGLRDKRGDTPLHSAVTTPAAGQEEALVQQAECVQLLLQHGAEVDAVDQSGLTSLQHAAWFGCAPSVDLLLQAGAQVQLRDQRGRTAQQLALERGHTAIAQLLGKRS